MMRSQAKGTGYGTEINKKLSDGACDLPAQGSAGPVKNNASLANYH